MSSIYIEDTEYELPDVVVTNADLESEFPEWDMARMTKRTGVRSRHIAAIGETALDLGYRAAMQMDRRCVDALIVCTETPDYPVPPNSCVLHGMLGLPSNVMAFDINMGCSGFVYGVGVARGLIVSGAAERVLLIAGDTYSRLIHPADRAVRGVFGDGVAAAIIGDRAVGFEVIDMSFATSGRQHEDFIVRQRGARGYPATKGCIEMDGAGILSFFSDAIPRAVRSLLSRNLLDIDDIELFVFHQASRVILDGLAHALRIPEKRFVFAMEDTGNTVSASIPIALRRTGHSVSAGGYVVLCGFGAGLSWATALVKKC
jgi:3-oxoacyl-[acyl-carrier-protein] synthase-3